MHSHNKIFNYKPFASGVSTKLAQLTSWLQWSSTFFPNYLLFYFFKQVLDTLLSLVSKLCSSAWVSQLPERHCPVLCWFYGGNWTGETCGSAGEAFCTCHCTSRYILLRLNIYRRKVRYCCRNQYTCFTQQSAVWAGLPSAAPWQEPGATWVCWMKPLGIWDRGPSSSQLFSDFIWVLLLPLLQWQSAGIPLACRSNQAEM